MIKKRNFIKCLLDFLLMKFNPHFRINPSYEDTGLSEIVRISGQVRSLAPEYEKEKGEPFITLHRGDVGRDTPDDITEALIKAIRVKKLTKYPQFGGEPWFKDAVLKYLSELGYLSGSGINDINRENVLCTHGGQQGLHLSFGAFASFDDKGNVIGGPRVLGLGSIWSCMPGNILPFSRSSQDLVPFIEKEGRLDVNFETLERKLSQTDMVYLNNPHNPTGKVFSREELQRINELCIKKNVIIVSDEAYDRIVYDDRKHVSMLEFPGEHIISAFTLSKAFAATGFRIGYSVSRMKILDSKTDEMVPLMVGIFTRAEYTETAGIPPFIQYAFKVALENRDMRERFIEDMRSELQERRDIMYDELTRIFGSDVYKPQGAFYFFLNLNPLIQSIPMERRDDFLLNRFFKEGVSIVPGGSFGCPGYIRISYSMINNDTALEGIRRMERVLKKFK
jgi:aspartate aminotransferase